MKGWEARKNCNKKVEEKNEINGKEKLEMEKGNEEGETREIKENMNLQKGN